MGERQSPEARRLASDARNRALDKKLTADARRGVKPIPKDAKGYVPESHGGRNQSPEEIAQATYVAKGKRQVDAAPTLSELDSQRNESDHHEGRYGKFIED